MRKSTIFGDKNWTRFHLKHLETVEPSPEPWALSRACQALTRKGTNKDEQKPTVLTLSSETNEVMLNTSKHYL